MNGAEIIEYRAAIQAIVICSRLLVQYDLAKLVEDINHAESFGCFTDPTLWINNVGKMREDKEMIEAAIPLWKLGNKLTSG